MKGPRSGRTRKDAGDKEDAPRAKRDLPIAPPSTPDTAPPSTPADSDPLAKWRAARELEEDMADIFDEDRVTHRHGDTEPEAD